MLHFKLNLEIAVDKEFDIEQMAVALGEWAGEHDFEIVAGTIKRVTGNNTEVEYVEITNGEMG